MIAYCFKRILGIIPTMLVLMTMTFFAMKIVPGGPFDGDRALPADIKANINAKYHFDEPIWKQYARYLNNALHGDLGPSYRYLGGRDVSQIIAEALPVSFELGAWAMILSIAVGVPLGVISAFKKNTWADFSTTFIAIAGISVPNFLIASLLILVFSVHLNWLPPALWDGWRCRILPVMTLAVRPLALIARLTRSSLIEALSMDYIRTAEAKGLGMKAVLFKHAFKNALVPVVTLLGPLTAAIITGSFVVEVIFAVPGMGRHFVGAVIDRDYTLIMGVTLVYGVIVLAANLIVDLLYASIDPRIRLTER